MPIVVVKTMPQYAADTLVQVYPFTRQEEAEQIVIGRPDTATFLSLSADAVSVLDDLAAGKTVGEAQALYAERYGETPDIVEFLETLEKEGFVFLGTASAATGGPAPLRFHFTGISQRWAERLFSPPVLLVAAVPVALAIVALAMQPQLLPDWRAMYVEENITLFRTSIILLSYFTVFLHEMAHLVAARSIGVNSRLSIGRRMWIWVAETDMTNMWSVPRHKRILPFLAGPIFDLVCASILFLLLFTDERGLIDLWPGAVVITKALLLNYIVGILWQFYFFVQTDFYYVIASVCNCKNLMADTYTYLDNLRYRWLKMGKFTDQSYLPAHELKTVRWYAWVVVAGRTIAISVALAVTLPLIWNYSALFINRTGLQEQPTDWLGMLDMAIVWVLFTLHQAAGVYLWVYGYVARWPVYIWLKERFLGLVGRLAASGS